MKVGRGRVDSTPCNKHFTARGRDCSNQAPCHTLEYVPANTLKNFITNLDKWVCDEKFEGVGGDILEGVAGCRGRTIPPPGGKMLDVGGGGRERSIKDSVIMMEIEINRFSIYKTTSFVEFSDFILHFWINNTFG